MTIIPVAFQQVLNQQLLNSWSTRACKVALKSTPGWALLKSFLIGIKTRSAAHLHFIWLYLSSTLPPYQWLSSSNSLLSSRFIVFTVVFAGPTSVFHTFSLGTAQLFFCRVRLPPPANDPPHRPPLLSSPHSTLLSFACSSNDFNHF